MIFRNMIFQLEVIKQRLPAGLVSHHEQASKANREQQHRVLWPAYNPNLATRQASTEGLFQHARLVTTTEPEHNSGRATHGQPSTGRGEEKGRTQRIFARASSLFAV